MKNFWLRITAFVLCILMVLPMLAACGDTGEGTTPAETTPADPPAPVVSRIEVDPDNAHDEIGFITAGNLFDEFATVGDPDANQGVAPENSPGKPTGWANEKGLSVSVDLGANYYVSHLYYYAATPEVALSFSTRLSRLDAWSSPVTTTSPATSQWIKVEINAECHYLHLEGLLGSHAPSEIVLYGYQTGESDPIPTKTERTEYPTIGELMGMNGNISCRTSNLAATTYLREYHNWLWNESTEAWEKGSSSINFTTTNVGSFDTFYLMCSKAGISPVPCMMFASDLSYFENGQSRPSWPLEDGTYDSEDPQTYFRYASTIYQYVARYGSNEFLQPVVGGDASHEHDWSKFKTWEEDSSYKIRTCSGCDAYQLQDLSSIRVLVGGKRVGLGYIEYIELGNEPNLTWEDAEDHSGPWQLAALTSAAYDGHEGTMGTGYGAICADPNIKVSMAGLAGSSLSYIRAMDMWAKLNRKDGEIPCDVFNVHTYCVKSVNVNGASISVGCSPEEYGLAESLQDLVEWRDTYYPDKEIWLSEFGWDTNQSYETKPSSHAYGEYTGRQVQAMWLVRSYILLSASGIDKAFMYMCNGSNDDTVGQYGTSGLIDGDGKKKDSWYYLNTLNNTMYDMAFQEDFASGHRDVMVYRYQNAEGKSAFVVWCPTSDGTKVENYELHLCGATTAELVEFANLEDNGIHSALTVDENGKVTVNVSECPIIILAE